MRLRLFARLRPPPGPTLTRPDTRTWTPARTRPTWCRCPRPRYTNTRISGTAVGTTTRGSQTIRKSSPGERSVEILTYNIGAHHIRHSKADYKEHIRIKGTLTLLDSRRCKITAGVSFLALYILFWVIWSLGTPCKFNIWGIEGPPTFF